MRDYIVRRLLILVPVMIGVSLLTFSLFNIIPGDACVLRLGFGSTPETLKACREAHGLNRPLFPVSINSDLPVIHVQGDSQYGGWLWDIVAHQDLGQSLAEGGAKVSTELERRLPITLEQPATVCLPSAGPLCRYRGGDHAFDTIRYVGGPKERLYTYCLVKGVARTHRRLAPCP